jgi:hypothetical protein
LEIDGGDFLGLESATNGERACFVSDQNLRNENPFSASGDKAKYWEKNVVRNVFSLLTKIVISIGNQRRQQKWETTVAAEISFRFIGSLPS